MGRLTRLTRRVHIWWRNLTAEPDTTAVVGAFAFGVFGVLVLVFAIIGVAFGVGAGESALIAGPEVIVATPEAGEFSNSVGTTRVAITRVQSSLNRSVWNIGSAAILIGIAVFFFGFASVLLSSSKTKLFATQSSKRLNLWTLGSMILVVFGGLARAFMEGRIVDASGLVAVDASDDDFSLFVFDIPFAGLVVGSQIITWLWQRAASIESDLEEVV